MKRLVITEDEKRRILGLHGSNIIMEQGNPKVTQIQTYLKGKGHNLGTSGANKDGVDGQWGGKTLAAIKAEFKVDLDDQGNIKTAETPTTTGSTTGSTTTTTPEAKIPTLPAGTLSTNKPPAQLAGQTTPKQGGEEEPRTFGN
jgi:hypothetical protein